MRKTSKLISFAAAAALLLSGCGTGTPAPAVSESEMTTTSAAAESGMFVSENTNECYHFGKRDNLQQCERTCFTLVEWGGSEE